RGRCPDRGAARHRPTDPADARDPSLGAVAGDRLPRRHPAAGPARTAAAPGLPARPPGSAPAGVPALSGPAGTRSAGAGAAGRTAWAGPVVGPGLPAARGRADGPAGLGRPDAAAAPAAAGVDRSP